MSVTWTRGKEWWIERTTPKGNYRYPTRIMVGPDSGISSEITAETIEYRPMVRSVWIIYGQRGLLKACARKSTAVKLLKLAGYEKVSPRGKFPCEIWEDRPYADDVEVKPPILYLEEKEVIY